MAKPPTVEDVARRAGVSRQTVSNVLNNPAIVRAPTRERVLSAIEELAYRPSAAARSLRTQRSSTIGIHLDPYRGGISGVLLDRFIHALTEEADDRGLRMLIYSAPSVEREIARLGDLVDGAEIDGVVITSTQPDDARTQWLTDNNVPFVAFGRPWGDDDVWSSRHSWVDVDGAAGTRQATVHAIDAFGPRVAWFGWPPDRGTGDDRESGWREEMHAHGLTGPIFRSLDDVGQARAAAVEVLSSDAGANLDAIICASDSLAVGAHLAMADTRVPHIELVGFDNTPVAEALGLSSVEQSPELVAEATLDLLTDDTGRRIGQVDAAAAQRVLVQPRLVLRGPGVPGAQGNTRG